MPKRTKATTRKPAVKTNRKPIRRKAKIKYPVQHTIWGIVFIGLCLSLIWIIMTSPNLFDLKLLEPYPELIYFTGNVILLWIAFNVWQRYWPQK